METEREIELCGVLINNAANIISHGFGVEFCLCDINHIVEIVGNNPNLKEVFIDIISKTLRNRDPSGLAAGEIPREISTLLAYQFRWTEIRNLALERIDKIFKGSFELARGDVSYSLLLAVAGEASEVDMYDYISESIKRL